MIDLNNVKPQRPEYDAEELSDELRHRATEWVPERFPSGRVIGDELRLADISGRAPRKLGSCVIKLKGENAGDWYDHSTGNGGQPLSTLKEATGLEGIELLELAAEICRLPTRRKNGHDTHQRRDPALDVQFILNHCVDASGSPVETYLASRGVDLPDCPNLRFHPSLTDWDAKIGRPGMVAIVRNPFTGEPTGGIHRTYLAEDGGGKADMPKSKMMLGPCVGGVVMLFPLTADGELGVAEGIESALSAHKLFGVPTWAALNDRGVGHMIFPRGLKRLWIFADRGESGERHAGQLYARAVAAGVEAHLVVPRSDDDFAEDLERGLWQPGEQPIVVSMPELAQPEIFLPPPARERYTQIDLVAMAQTLTREDSAAITRVLEAAAMLNEFDRLPVLDIVKQRTRIGLTLLNKTIEKINRKQADDKRDLAPRPAWIEKCALWENGEPKAIIANVAIPLRDDEELTGMLGYNEFTEEPMLVHRPPFDHGGSVLPRPWTDDDTLRLTEWLQVRGLHVNHDIVNHTVDMVARENNYHPVREWLETLHWDGQPRLDFWLQNYCAAEDSPYVRAVGSRFLISAVARVYEPGCKADNVLILEGQQDMGKSNAAQALFYPWFTDEIADFGSKDAALQLRGVWGIELSELDVMDRVEIRRIKAFLSRTDDRYKPPYGRRVITQSRQCVFLGTTNDQGYLRDPTGGRRFWPVECRGSTVDYQGLVAQREQIWAEAFARYRGGEQWYLHETELKEMAREEQLDRYQGDAWDARIAAFLHNEFPPGTRRSRPDWIQIGDILERALGLDPSRWGQSEQNRVAKYLKLNGWRRMQQRNHDNSREWGYRRMPVESINV